MKMAQHIFHNLDLMADTKQSQILAELAQAFASDTGQEIGAAKPQEEGMYFSNVPLLSQPLEGMEPLWFAFSYLFSNIVSV